MYLNNKTYNPFLPTIDRAIKPQESGEAKKSGDLTEYYITTLRCAQSLLSEDKPAQALLQLNHSLSIDLQPEVLQKLGWELPYRAKVWIYKNMLEQGFIGNPVRHYQHLATRVNEPMKALRSWRAWACFHLAEKHLPEDLFPRDERQISKEELSIPTWEKALQGISKYGIKDESELLQQLYQEH